MTDTWTTIRFDALVLAREGAPLDSTFTAPTSGWYEYSQGVGWRLIEERSVPECPRLKKTP